MSGVLIIVNPSSSLHKEKADQVRAVGMGHEKLTKIIEAGKEKLQLTEHQFEAIKNWKDQSTKHVVKDLKESLDALKRYDVLERLKKAQELLKNRVRADYRSEL